MSSVSPKKVVDDFPVPFGEVHFQIVSPVVIKGSQFPGGALRCGADEVGVAIHARPPNLRGQVVLGRLDLIVTYPEA